MIYGRMATSLTLRGPDALLGHGLFRADSYLGEVVAFPTIRRLDLVSSPIKESPQWIPVLEHRTLAFLLLRYRPQDRVGAQGITAEQLMALVQALPESDSNYTPMFKKDNKGNCAPA